jgi:hypothetical protein
LIGRKAERERGEVGGGGAAREKEMVETNGKEVLGRWWFACLVWTRPCKLLSRGATVRLVGVSLQG